MNSINPILEDFPNTIKVENICYEINTDFRLFLKLFDGINKKDELKVQTALLLISSHYVVNGFIEKLLEFTTLCEIVTNEPVKKSTTIKNLIDGNSTRNFDICFDSDIIFVDFLREYHINLYDKSVKMHWLEFKLLLNNLSSNSSCENRKSLRNLKKDDVAKDKISDLAKLQQALNIDVDNKPKTLEERNQLMKEYVKAIHEEAKSNENK